jgi:hypothetical protein
MSSGLGTLLAFIAELDQRQASYRLSVTRPEAIMVEIAVPGERWEVEFLESGEVEVERFRSQGHITDENSLAELWAFLD